jgi:hypothetical protein
MLEVAVVVAVLMVALLEVALEDLVVVAEATLEVTRFKHYLEVRTLVAVEVELVDGLHLEFLLQVLADPVL